MKFQTGDIIGVSGNRYPIIILGTHTFPDGSMSYRFRHCHPQLDDDNGDEYWDSSDGYIKQEYIDANYELIWRKP